MNNVSCLSNTELQNLFISQNHHLMDGIDQGLAFKDLKEIRVNIRAIVAEMETRKIPSPTIAYEN